MKHVKVIQINAVNGYGSTGVIVKDIEKCLLSNDCMCVWCKQKRL